MKHLFIVDSCYPAELGGPSNSIYLIAKNLKYATILSSDKGIKEEHIKKYDINYSRTSNINGVDVCFIKRGIIFLYYFKSMCWLFSELKSYQLVHLSSFFHPISFLCAVMCVLMGVEFTVSPRGELFDAALGIKKTRKKLLLKSYLLLYRKAKYIWVTTLAEKICAQKYFYDFMDIKVIPNGIEFDSLFKPLNRKDREYFLFVGRIAPIKNIENIILAYQRLGDNIKDEIPLWIAGQGDSKYLEKLQSLVNTSSDSNRIKFIGHISGEEKKRIMSKAICGFLVSKSENFGNVILEFLSNGVPVITTNNLPWEHLNDLGIGITVEQGNTLSISKEMRYLSTIPNEQYEKISALGIDFVKFNYSLTEFEQKLN